MLRLSCMTEDVRVQRVFDFEEIFGDLIFHV